MHEMINAYTILIRMPEGKIPLGRTWCRLEDNIKIYLRKIKWEIMD
jgi:hypothetical protein